MTQEKHQNPCKQKAWNAWCKKWAKHDAAMQKAEKESYRLIAERYNLLRQRDSVI